MMKSYSQNCSAYSVQKYFSGKIVLSDFLGNFKRTLRNFKKSENKYKIGFYIAPSSDHKI